MVIIKTLVYIRVNGKMKSHEKIGHRIFDAISLVFWIGILVTSRRVRFEQKENSGLVTIMLVGLTIYLFIYKARLSKLKKIKQKIKRITLRP